MNATANPSAPVTIPQLHTTVEVNDTQIAPATQVFSDAFDPADSGKPQILQPNTVIPLAPPPTYVNQLPLQGTLAQRRALLHANRLLPILIADLTRLEGHWYRRVGAYRALERHVSRLRGDLRSLGYAETDLPRLPTEVRLEGESKHAWRPRWADAVTYQVGRLYAVHCIEYPDTNPVPIPPTPTPIPEPPADEGVIPTPEP